MSEPVTFVCIDCGVTVHRWPAHLLASRLPRRLGIGCKNEIARCSTCQWIAGVPDPSERERIKTWLAEIEADPGRLRSAKGPRS